MSKALVSAVCGVSLTVRQRGMGSHPPHVVDVSFDQLKGTGEKEKHEEEEDRAKSSIMVWSEPRGLG